jgi:cytosine/adenosine deaminase-related metal-dependent hydrolase
MGFQRDNLVMVTAEAVFPVAGPPVRRGAVVMQDGRVVAVGSAEELGRKFAGAERVEMKGHVLVPGLVNAHCHLELGYLRGKLPAGHFVEWVNALVRTVLAQGPAMERVVTRAVSEGVQELLRGGVTRVGDITRQAGFSRAALRKGPVRAVSFGEVAGIGSRRGDAAGMLAAAMDERLASETMAIGVSPHAPYTVEGPVLRQAVEAARRKGLPMRMHVAELTEEREFLATLGGRLREAWDVFGTAHEILDAAIPRFEGGAIRWAREWGLLECPVSGVQLPDGKKEADGGVGATLLAHVNHADDEELEIVRMAGASVAYCPRTRAFFGHDVTSIHRFREMMYRGINVCLATDSLASNPDLFLLREGQFVLRKFPEVSPGTVLEMMTVNGARALGLGDGEGTLVAGGVADMAAFPAGGGGQGSLSGVLGGVIAEAPPAGAVWIGGEKVL